MMKPYPFQETAIQRSIVNNTIIADECGLGKTLDAVEIIRRRMHDIPHPVIEPSLVITPLRVIGQWANLLRWQIPDVELIILDARSVVHVNEIRRENVVVLMHYEALPRVGVHLARIKFDVVVCDEVHRIKNRRAQRTTFVKLIHANRLIGLSGTPMDKPDEVWSLLNWVDPIKFRSYWKFVDEFCIQEETPYGYKKIVGARNPQKFAAMLEPYMIRRLKSEVVPQLPPRIITDVPLVLPAKVRKAYDKLRTSKELEIDLDDNVSVIVRNAGALMTLLQMMTSDPACLEVKEMESVKRSFVVEYIEDNPDEAVVVFTKFRKSAEMLSQELSCPLVMGGQDNNAAIDEFVDGHSNIIVGTIAAMGEGLNLQRASTAIFVDTDWSTIRMSQAIDRIHRIDITEPKNIIFLYAEDTVDKYILRAYREKLTKDDAILMWLNEEFRNGKYSGRFTNDDGGQNG